MSYVILGTYNGETEEIDTADDLDEARGLKLEYELAYGPSWRIKIAKAADE